MPDRELNHLEGMIARAPNRGDTWQYVQFDHLEEPVKIDYKAMHSVNKVTCQVVVLFDRHGYAGGRWNVELRRI